MQKNVFFGGAGDQTSANWSPDTRFVLEVIIKALMSKLNSSRVINLKPIIELFLKNDTRSSYLPKFGRVPNTISVRLKLFKQNFLNPAGL